VTRATENRGREPRTEGENEEKCEEREKIRENETERKKKKVYITGQNIIK
jgi:hypothetical protein